MRRLSLGLLALLLLAPATLADEQTLKTFDVCWKRVKSHFYDRDLHGLDWNAIRDEYRPLADAAEPGDELHRVLNRMLSELKASHVTLMAGDVHQSMIAELTNRPTLTAGVMLEIVAPDRYHVRAQYEGGPGEKAGL